jgi:hypothetical protein
MQPADDLQIDYVNYEKIDSPFNSYPFRVNKKLSNVIRVNTNVIWDLALFDDERYSSILPLQWVSPDQKWRDTRLVTYKELT